MKFSELKFKEHPGGLGGIQATVYFDNGYGASIVQTQYSYGGSEGLYELAVLKGNEKFNTLCYDTSITNDVIGHLEKNEVEEVLEKIKNLPKEIDELIEADTVKPYVIMINKSDGKRFCLDRNYVLIPPDKVNPPLDMITISHIIEVAHDFFPTFKYQYPDWAEEYLNFREDFVTLWTDLYE